MEINPDWWKTLFDETYLITDARSVCDDRLTQREVDTIERFLKLDKSHAVLDLCGGHGRHALELARRGFHDLTVVDYSGVLIGLGREQARAQGFSIQFVQADARSTGLPADRFQAVTVMANSFGYFSSPADDEVMLREVHRVLAAGGMLLLDLVDKEYLIDNFKAHSWHEANEEIVVCREKRLADDLVLSREIVLSKTEGLLRDEKYCVRLYAPEQISRLLTASGFDTIHLHRGYTSHERSSDYGFMTRRMFVTAHKPPA